MFPQRESHAQRAALKVFASYPERMRSHVDAQWARTPDATKIEPVRFALGDVSRVVSLLQEWFFSGADTGVPPSLVRAVEAECRALCLEEREALVVVGPVHNFETLVSDLVPLVFAYFGKDPAEQFLETHPQRYAFIKVPRLEGTSPQWWPVVVGHEVAHLAIDDLRVLDSIFATEENVGINGTDAAALEPPELDDHDAGLSPLGLLVRRMNGWLEELVCDLYSVRRYGPGAICALGTFLESVGEAEHASTHPPGLLRVQTMLSHIPPTEDERVDRMLAPWREASGGAMPLPPWAQWVWQGITGRWDLASVTSLLTPAAESPVVADEVHRVADRLCEDLPTVRAKGGRLLTEAELVTGGWLADHERAVADVAETREPETVSEGPTRRRARLLLYAMKQVDRERRWEGAADDVSPPPQGQGVSTDASASDAATGLLTQTRWLERVRSSGDDRIEVIPFEEHFVGASALDLRLGDTFIVFQRSSTGAYDTVRREVDPRVIQEYVRKDWSETFVLHPGELVLASVLEYIALPGDVAGQVMTRSSYGRLGLITATAVHVHPYYRGCLTLELVNHGDLPLRLTPGERVAQLVLHSVRPPLTRPPSTKYRAPTEPEFSRVGEDWDARVLEQMRGKVE